MSASAATKPKHAGGRPVKGDSERIVKRVESETYDEARVQAWARWCAYLTASK